jgi:hypothetical protein
MLSPITNHQADQDENKGQDYGEKTYNARK